MCETQMYLIREETAEIRNKKTYEPLLDIQGFNLTAVSSSRAAVCYRKSDQAKEQC